MSKKSIGSIDDIPEAFRDASGSIAPQSRQARPGKWRWWLGLSTLGILAAIAASSFWLIPRLPGLLKPRESVLSVPPTATSPAAPAPSPPTLSSTNELLGHFAYAEAPQSELESVDPNRPIQLRKAAAAAFRQMVAAARADGILLVPISGFRNLSDQNYLFFEVKAKRGQSAQKRAEVSAPPGYSEHHTGYAIDIGDGNAPDLDLKPEFEKTAAFRWLQANAAHFSFELSFPPNNPQGVTYEPWHWRFVGDRQSLETFYKARTLMK